MTNVHIGHHLLASMNAARAEHAEEGRSIHDRFLLGIKSADTPSTPDPLVWSDELADGAAAYAARCARWRHLSHEDLEDGSGAYERIRQCMPCNIVAENLATGDVSWLTPTRCHEQFMSGSSAQFPTRENILNPAFTHAGVGYAEDDGAAYYVVSFACVDPAATAATPRMPVKTPVWIVPLWEPEPVRWRIELKPDGPDLRTQIGERFSIDARRLTGIGLRDSDALVLDRRPDALAGQSMIAISLSQFEPRFIALRSSSSAAATTHSTGAGTDNAPAAALDLLTEYEVAAIDVVRASRAAPLVSAVDIDPAVLMPERRPGSPIETIITQLTVDVRPENDEERQSAVRLLDRAARYHEPLMATTRHEYDLRQELSLGLERDLLLREHQQQALREAIDTLSIETAAQPILFAIPYDRDDGHAAFISAAAHRVSLLKLQEPEVTRAFLEAYRAAAKQRRAIPNTEPLALSTYRSVSLIAAGEWESETVFWAGAQRAANGIFRDLAVLPIVCEGDAKEIVERALDRTDDDNHPLHRLAVLTRDALLRRLTRIDGLPVAPLDTRRRKEEPRIIAELSGLIEDPTPVIESIPEARALLQEASWLTQSRLRTEIERMYLRYRAGEEGRNVTAFARMLKLAGHHLGASVADAEAKEHIPLTHRIADGWSAESAARYRDQLQPLRNRYLRGWQKRLARLLLPRGRSSLHGDMRPSVNRLAINLVEIYWARRLRNIAASRAFSLPVVAAQAVDRLSRDVLRDIGAEASLQRSRLERFAVDPTAVVLGTDPTRAVESAARAADLWWSKWLAGTREKKWMHIGAAILGNALGHEESPFGMFASRITERLIRAVGQERPTEAAPSLSDADLDAALAVMFERGSFAGVVDPYRLLEITNRHYPQQPSTLPLRTTWIVVIGRPLAGKRAEISRLSDALSAKKGIDYANLICVEAASISGIHFIAECHGFPASALAL